MRRRWHRAIRLAADSPDEVLLKAIRDRLADWCRCAGERIRPPSGEAEDERDAQFETALTTAVAVSHVRRDAEYREDESK
jgi:hypothetical protein